MPQDRGSPERPGRWRLAPARIDLAFSGLAVLACAWLLYLSRDLTFHWDEWTVIAGRPWRYMETVFAPHNEHFSTLLYLVYGGLYETVGLRSYLPYLGVLLVLHGLAAAALYRLVAIRGDRWLAVLAGVVFLLLGAASEDLFWAFQMGFIGSATAGLWALVFALRSGPRNAVAAAWLVTASLAFSGMGLPFLAAALVLVAVRDGPTRRALWVLAPVLVYAVWFFLEGRSRVGIVLSPETLALAARVGATGIAQSFAATFGLPFLLGAAAAAVAFGTIAVLAVRTVAGAIRAWRSGSGRQLDDGILVAIAAAIGLLAEFTLIGLARGDFGGAAFESRYFYAGGAFALLMVGGLLAGRVPVESPARRRSVVVVAGLATVVALSANLQALQAGHAEFQNYASGVKAFVAVVGRHGRAPDVDQSRTMYPLPLPALLLARLAEGAWPADQLDPSRLPPDRVDRALMLLVGHAFQVTAGPVDDPGPRPSDPPRLRAAAGATVTERGSCLLVGAETDQAVLDLDVADGALLTVAGPAGQEASADLGRYDARRATASHTARLSSDRPISILIPRLADGGTWRLRLNLWGGGSWELCAPGSADAAVDP